MIRQAISCDICGTEMLNANHWFVAYDRGPELRIGAWSGENRPRAAARHLCGHKCLHKLVDDFMARMQSGRASATVEMGVSNQADLVRTTQATDTSLTWAAPAKRATPQMMASPVQVFTSTVQPINPAEQIAPRAPGPTALRAEAWKRERERQRVAEQSAPHRRSIA